MIARRSLHLLGSPHLPGPSMTTLALGPAGGGGETPVDALGGALAPPTPESRM
jgi:hypothetical protein